MMKRLLALAVLLAACRPHPPVPTLTAPPATPPPETAAARLLRTDFTFAEWRASLGREPTSEDLSTLLDTLTDAQKQAPSRTLALSQDAELRRRVLRAPELRAKAGQILGMSAPEGVPVPDVKQLLHTTPGDNCPVCRMRAKMDQAGNGL